MLQQADRVQRFLPREQFNSRLDFVFRLQRRTRCPVKLATFELNELDNANPSEFKEGLLMFRNELFTYVRENDDVAFAYQLNPKVIAVVMPVTSQKQAQRMCKELYRTLVDKLATAPVLIKYELKIVPQSTSKDGTDVEESWQEAERFLTVPG